MKFFQIELEYFVILFHPLCSERIQISGELDQERSKFLFRVCLLLRSCYCDCTVGCTLVNFKLAGLARVQ